MQRSANKFWLVILLLPITRCVLAQEALVISDMEHINNLLSQSKPDPYKRSYIYRDETSLLKKLNPVGLGLGGLLYFYQNVLSKHISADCLYSPSCSEFGKQSIKGFGIVKGTLMTLDRVNRCNRIAAVDLKNYSRDPVSRRYPDPVTRHSKSPPKDGE